MRSSRLVSVLARAGSWYALSQILVESARARVRLRRVISGLIYIASALLIGFVGMQALAAGLFFWLASLDTLVQPAFISAGILLLVAAFLGWEGLHRITASH